MNIALSDFEIGNHRIACPHCSKRASDKTLGITVKTLEDIVAHCFRCGFSQSHRGKITYAPRTRIQPQYKAIKRQGISEYWLDVWKRCEPISGLAENYLKSRNCVIPPKDSHLRWHPSLKHPSDYVGAALVALITHQHTGEALSIHRTWITSTGKADVYPVRMFAANQSIEAGVIRLWSDEYVGHGLGVAEGIETALSLAHVITPVWALMDAGHLAAFEVMRGVECLTIAVDQDRAGINASNQCAARWHKAGHTVYLTTQRQNDFNDYVRAA